MALYFTSLKAIKEELKGETINFKACEKIRRLVIFAASFHCGPKNTSNKGSEKKQTINTIGILITNKVKNVWLKSLMIDSEF